MLRKSVAALLICAGVLLANAPSRILAQTPAGGLTRPTKASAEQAAGLKTAFAEVAAKNRADTAATEADLTRLGREWLNPRAEEKAGRYTTKEKVLVISIVAGIVILAVVLALNTEKGGHSFCDIDPADPDCIGTR